MLEELKTEHKAIGLKQSGRLLNTGSVKKAFVAENAAPAVITKFVNDCGASGVPVEYVSTMEMLGRACGIEVGAAIAVITV